MKPDASWRSRVVAREDTTQGETRMKEVILLGRTFYDDPSSGFAFVRVIKNKELGGQPFTETDRRMLL